MLMPAVRADARVLFSAAVRRRLTIVVVCSLVLSIAELGATLLVPLLAQVLLGGSSERTAAVGRVLGAEGATELVTRMILVIVGVFVLKNLLGALFRFWSLGFVQRQQAATSQALLGRYLRASPGEHIRRSTEVALRRIESSVNQVYSVLVTGAVAIITESLTILVMLVALAIVTGLSFLIAAVVVGALAVSMWLLSRVSRRVGETALRATQDTYRIVLRALGSYKEVRLRAMEDEVLADFREASDQAARAAQLAGFLGELPRHLLETLFLLALGVAVLVAAPDLPTAGATLALLVVVAFRMLPSTTRLLSSWSAVRMAWPAVREVVDDLSAAGPDESATDRRPMPFEDRIELRGLRFRYGPEHPWVLTDVTGVIPKGSRIALVGHSGAGKSTLGDLLAGLLVDYEGEILVDGEPLRGQEPRWRPHVAIVPQDPYIQHDTLRRNIVFSHAEPVDEARLESALRRAQVVDEVRALPDGLDTVLPERGLGLSGGQRQRIALARALYRDSSILILDEATSALDTDTESRGVGALAALPDDITVIVVAHRLRTAYAMAHVAVLEGGTIAAFGTPDEVASENETFRRWVRLNALGSSASDPPEAAGDSPRAAAR
jgi:ABC-type multidrug transport system fused ATPase/permease subunit